jgi:proteasome assembly chaperone (PAC2) family protein
MIPFLFGAAKGYATLVGVAVISFMMPMKRIEVQMDELEIQPRNLQPMPELQEEEKEAIPAEEHQHLEEQKRN